MKKIGRRKFLKFASLSALGVQGCSLLSQSGRSGVGNRPNVIFLLTDDQRWDAMGCAGNAYIQTPNMDKLASEGVFFSNAFVTTPICCVSRASIFSGQYSRRHGIHDFGIDFTCEAFNETYPSVLRNAGYRTGFIGKYGVGSNMPENKFDYWKGIKGQPVYEHKDANGNYKHLTSIMGEQAVDFIKNSKSNQPFCLSVSFKAPHAQDEEPKQFIYDEALGDLYEDVEIPLPETSDEKYFNALPDFLKDSEARKRWKVRFSTHEKYQQSVKGYYRLVTGVDLVIAIIRDQLEQSGLSDNTVIILMGDNGFFLGEKGLAGKWYPLEESIRVPLVIYHPGLDKNQRGSVVKKMALNIDIAPTILDIANAPIPQAMQGKSLNALLQNKTIAWRKDFLIEHLFDHDTIVKSEAVRTEKWKYIRYLTGDNPYHELYNLELDPSEVNNIADGNENRLILQKLRHRCDQLIENAK